MLLSVMPILVNVLFFHENVGFLRKICVILSQKHTCDCNCGVVEKVVASQSDEHQC